MELTKLTFGKDASSDNWFVAINGNLLEIDCYREIKTLETLKSITRKTTVPDGYITLEFVGEKNDFDVTLKKIEGVYSYDTKYEMSITN